MPSQADDGAMPASAYLWCPAYPLLDQAHLERARNEARWLATGLGLELVESPRLAHFAGVGDWPDPRLRLADLERAWSHPVLIAARGGYGCVDLLARVLDPASRAPGLLIGYSDLTVLHACWRRRGWGEGLYGFMPGIPHGKRARATTLALAKGEGYAVDRLSDPPVVALRPGAARGPVFAACLSVLASLAGTPAMPDLRGCILALEDIDERPYRIDRQLQQLAGSGALAGIAGLVLGGFAAANPPTYAGPSAVEICRRWAERLAVPTIAGLPFGHDPDPLCLPCGRMGELDCAGEQWRLSILAKI